VLDPLISTIISIALGLMFLMAAVHKFSDLARFQAVLADYRVMPASIVPVLAALLPLGEVLLGLCWLFSNLSVWLPTAGLLALYTAGIAINLLRGRVHISCGCGFGNSTGADDALSWGLVMRNALLIAAALVTILPVSVRAYEILDYVTLVAALLASILLFTATNQLIRNQGAINTWRHKVRRDN
jgi:hypothetical protein